MTSRLEFTKIVMTTTLAFAATLSVVPCAMAADLEVVATFEKNRPGNMTITPDGRIIFTMSALGNPDVNVMELMKDGSFKPFPNASWAGRTGRHGYGISTTIGIKADAEGVVWVLDMGNATNAPKLVGWDTTLNKLRRSIVFPSGVISKDSFVQDLAIDIRRQKAYVADMTFDKVNGTSPSPAILVVDLITGDIRRVLEGDKALRAEGSPLTVEGRTVAHLDKSGKSVEHFYGLNPIALDPQGEWVYFGAMGGKMIYRIPAASLADSSLPGDQLARRIEPYRAKPHCDGFVVDMKGDVYITDVEDNAIGVARADGYHILVKDKEKLSFPDGFAISPDGGYLYIVVNQLHNLPQLNRGVDSSKPPYYIYRVKLNA